MQPDSEAPTGHRDTSALTGAELAKEFRRIWTASDDPPTATADLFPSRLAKASAMLLNVNGAGLSAYGARFRVPLGASDEAALLAERLQFTQGEGPCLAAIREQRSVVADLETLETRWPAYAAELCRHTPYRAVMSLPVKTKDFAGALDLFLADTAQVRRVSVADALTITGEIGYALNIIEAMGQGGIPDEPRDEVGPSWLHSPSARNRTQVWIAAGILMARHHLGATDAVALLRSFAYGHDTVIDEVARQMVDGELDSQAVVP